MLLDRSYQLLCYSDSPNRPPYITYIYLVLTCSMDDVVSYATYSIVAVMYYMHLLLVIAGNTNVSMTVISIANSTYCCSLYVYATDVLLSAYIYTTMME